MEELLNAVVAQGGPVAIIAAGFGSVIWLLFRFITNQTERNEARNDQLREGLDKVADAISVVSNTLNLVLHEVEGFDAIGSEVTKFGEGMRHSQQTLSDLTRSIEAVRREVAAITGRRDTS